MTSYPFFKMATAASQFYFRFRFSWLRSFRKVGIYPQTKFRPGISIHGWNITTSGFRKQMSAVLEFYFRFRFSRLHHCRHVILRLPVKFRPNRIVRGGVMTSSYPFSRWRPRHRNSSSGFVFVTSLCKTPREMSTAGPGSEHHDEEELGDWWWCTRLIRNTKSRRKLSCYTVVRLDRCGRRGV